MKKYYHHIDGKTVEYGESELIFFRDEPYRVIERTFKKIDDDTAEASLTIESLSGGVLVTVEDENVE